MIVTEEMIQKIQERQDEALMNITRVILDRNAIGDKKGMQHLVSLLMSQMERAYNYLIDLEA